MASILFRTPDLYAAYLAARKDSEFGPIHAYNAVLRARYVLAGKEKSDGPSFGPWDGPGDSRTWEEDGFQVRATIERDDYQSVGDLDFYGSVKRADDLRDRSNAVRLTEEGYRTDEMWLVLDNGNSYAELREGWSRDGKALADAKARACIRHSVERVRAWLNDEWTYCYVTVTVSRAGVVLAESSLHGIESDAGEYFNEIARDCASDALSEAPAALADLCAKLCARTPVSV